MGAERNYITLYSRLYLFNNFLAVMVFLFCGWILVAPYLPELILPLQNKLDKSDGFVYENNLDGGSLERLKPRPKENRLVIPKIKIDAEINEGDARALSKGIWLQPDTSNPSLESNTVLLAHRRMYTSGPNTFYHLPKMKVGDKFLIFWEGVEYDYEVIETKEVGRKAVEITDPTDEPIVTLYTCTPLFTSRMRFVVVGKLIKKS